MTSSQRRTWYKNLAKGSATKGNESNHESFVSFSSSSTTSPKTYPKRRLKSSSHTRYTSPKKYSTRASSHAFPRASPRPTAYRSHSAIRISPILTRSSRPKMASSQRASRPIRKVFRKYSPLIALFPPSKSAMSTNRFYANYQPSKKRVSQ